MFRRSSTKSAEQFVNNYTNNIPIKKIDVHIQNNAFNQGKILSYWYQGTDIQYIGNQLTSDFSKVVFVGPIAQGDSEKLAQHRLALANDKCLVGVYNANNNHWIAFIIKQDATGKLTAFYKDSYGSEYKNFVDDVKAAFANAECQPINTTTEQLLEFENQISNGNGLVSCGVFALKNMEIFAKCFNEKNEVEKQLFFTPSIATGSINYSADIAQTRNEFAVLYAKEVYQQTVTNFLLEEKRKWIREQHKNEAQKLFDILYGNIPIQGKIEIATTDNLELVPNYYYIVECFGFYDEMKEYLNKICEKIEVINENKKFILKIYSTDITQNESTQELFDLIEKNKTILSPIFDESQLDKSEICKNFFEALGVNVLTDELQSIPVFDKLSTLLAVDTKQLKDILVQVYGPINKTKINKSNHIAQLNFDNVTANSAFASLMGAKEWKDIPQLVVLTGRNGIGKSHLLLYLTKTLGHEKVNVLFREADHQDYNFSSSDSNSTNNYYIQDTNARNKLIEEVFNYFLSPHLENNHPTKFYFNIVVRILKKKYKPEQITRELIEEVILTAVDPQIKAEDLYHPRQVLDKVFNQYVQRKKALVNRYGNMEHTEELFKFYLGLNDKENSIESFTSFMRLLKEKDGADQLINTYVISKMQRPPWEEINDILKKYDFAYSFSLKNDAHNPNKLETILLGNGVEIKPSQLSSGEKMILDMLAWPFCHQNIDVGDSEETERVDIMVLDEPDKHLDPELCKTFFKLIEIYLKEWGIQVIMTTHRTDTVALVPESIGKIFSIERDENRVATIVPDTKLNAMFRLTSNLRDLINFNIRTYVEAHDDAVFYETAYRALSNYCEEVRNENRRLNQPKNLRYFWKALADTRVAEQEFSQDRILSRRYQLSFHSTATDAEGSSGGCSGVKNAVLRDYHSHKIRGHHRLQNFLIDSKIEYPFGLLDKDHYDNILSNNNLKNKQPKDPKREAKRQLYKQSKDASAAEQKQREEKPTEAEADLIAKNRIIILKRHSIENFLYDPFIFCSALSEKVLSSFTDKNFKTICINIKNTLDENDIAKLKENLQEYFLLLSKKLPVEAINDLPVPDGELPSVYRKNIKEKKEILRVILSSKQIIAIEYPFVLLYCQGHAIEDVVENLAGIKAATDKKSSLKKELIDALVLADNLYLPVDLVETLFQLNDKVRAQVTEVTKPKPSI